MGAISGASSSSQLRTRNVLIGSSTRLTQ
jgi:hypothetical protein